MIKSKKGKKNRDGGAEREGKQMITLNAAFAVIHILMHTAPPKKTTTVLLSPRQRSIVCVCQHTSVPTVPGFGIWPVPTLRSHKESGAHSLRCLPGCLLSVRRRLLWKLSHGQRTHSGVRSAKVSQAKHTHCQTHTYM